jgi:hypothetical protein
VLIEGAMGVGVAGELVASGGYGSDSLGKTLGDFAYDEKGAAHAGPAEEGEEALGQFRQGGAVEGFLPLDGVEFLEIDGEEEGFHAAFGRKRRLTWRGGAATKRRFSRGDGRGAEEEIFPKMNDFHRLQCKLIHG